jgi:hypothetical protein
VYGFRIIGIYHWSFWHRRAKGISVYITAARPAPFSTSFELLKAPLFDLNTKNLGEEI